MLFSILQILENWKTGIIWTWEDVTTYCILTNTIAADSYVMHDHCHPPPQGCFRKGRKILQI